MRLAQRASISGRIFPCAIPSRHGDGCRHGAHAGCSAMAWRRFSWRGLPRRLGRGRLSWRMAWGRVGRRLAWRLGPSRMGRRLGLAARRLGSRLGRRLGRRMLELRLGLGRRLGLGLRSRLGDRSRDSAARGRDRGQRRSTRLWRRSGLLGEAADLDSGRTLSWPAPGEYLLLRSASGRKQDRPRGKGFENCKTRAAIMNICSAFTANTYL